MNTVPLYEYLKMLRTVAGYSKSDVAAWLCISPSAYGHYETDRYLNINDRYLRILEQGYNLRHNILSKLPLVRRPQTLFFKQSLSEAENLAAFLHFFSDPKNLSLYKNLSLQEKWLIYYYYRSKNKEALLYIVSAAPEISALFFPDF